MDMGQWRGLFEWSMKYQDGTKPTNYDHSSFTPEKKEWLENAMKEYLKDFAERMREIKGALDDSTEHPATLEQKEALLEELVDITSSIDQARDLHKLGGLPTLLDLLSSQHPSLRWRAAEVVATCVQNNPPVQQWFLEGGALPKLVALMEDPEAACRAKALLALSSLIRHFPAGLAAFRQEGGLPKLLHLLQTDDPRLLRKALSTLEYVLSQSPEDSLEACQAGALPLLTAATTSEDGNVREAALKVLLELAQQRSCAGCFAQTKAEVQEAMQQLRQRHQQLPQEEQEACEDELPLSQQLEAALQQHSAGAGADGAGGRSSSGAGGGAAQQPAGGQLQGQVAGLLTLS